MKTSNQERALQFVTSAVAVIKARLIADLGLDEDRAAELARNCAHDICADQGGRFMYVPRDMGFELTKRDREIFDRFNGRNQHQLGEEYNLTPTRIYQIVAQVKAQLVKERQGILPGLDDQQ